MWDYPHNLTLKQWPLKRKLSFLACCTFSLFPEGFLYLLGLFIYKGQAAQCQPGAACPIHIYFQILIQYIFTDFVKVRKAA